MEQPELLRLVKALELSQTPLTPPVLERKLMHHSSLHRILLVGEGNFSFSSSLANAFDCAHNIVARSLDSREVLRVYDTAGLSISNLERRGALLMYEIDAIRMDQVGNLIEED
ncbi:hypothetical protein SUGI_0086610 [Cryptomeria japonica]|nr:hypothetical protein SUGI_0086610 [Cryptomeria japonica]